MTRARATAAQAARTPCKPPANDCNGTRAASRVSRAPHGSPGPAGSLSGPRAIAAQAAYTAGYAVLAPVVIAGGVTVALRAAWQQRKGRR